MPTEQLPPPLVPLAVLAAELDQTVDRLAHRYRAAVQRDHLGFRSVPPQVAQTAIAARDQALAERTTRRATSDDAAQLRHRITARQRGDVATDPALVAIADAGLAATRSRS